MQALIRAIQPGWMTSGSQVRGAPPGGHRRAQSGYLLPPALKPLAKLINDREKAIREVAEVALTDLRARNSVDRPEA